MTREELEVKAGFEYDVYFPKALGGSITKKKGATVADTIRFIPTVVRDTTWQTKRFAHEVVKADTLYQTCKNIWEFVFNHIAYKKDEDGKEQVRSPARTWRDRHNFDAQGNPSGVDCDCYTVFISSILSNLKIKHVLRITKYGEPHFQHIYPIVPTGNGRYITIDCVVKQFDYEEPYTEKKDTAMDLEYLNGVSGNDPSQNKNNDAQDLMGMMSEREAMMELGKIFKRKTAEQKKERRAKVKQFLNKGLHVTNRLNPATAAIRAGVLAAMKVNFMKIGSELKYTYLPEAEAQKRGINMGRFAKMKRIREKLEKLFYGAGGKPENLKKAILTGHGNKDKAVPLHGLGYVPYENVDGLNEDMHLSELLGTEMYTSEGMHEINGLGELGEPVTAATITAASTILTTIFAMIKKVGSLVPKKNGGKDVGDSGGDTSSSDASTNDSPSNENSSGENSSGDSASTDTSTTTTSTDESVNSTKSTTAKASTTSTNSTSSNNGAGTADTANENASSSNTNSNATTTDKTDAETEENKEDAGNAVAKRTASTNSNAKETASNTKTDKVSFWEKNKKWIKPTGIAVGSLGLIALAYHLFKPKPKPQGKPAPAVNGLDGIKKKSTKKHLLSGIKSTGKKKITVTVKKTHKPKKKKVVTLL